METAGRRHNSEADIDMGGIFLFLTPKHPRLSVVHVQRIPLTWP
ncbi:hypothetical protein LEMLEM_LOCUS18554, partial [Lemmus lemmus]